jgi:2'-5' RNA ligase
MLGITIRASAVARPFRQLVNRVSAFESEPSAAILNYAPHLTLARCENIDPTVLTAALDAFDGVHRISLVFDRICMFDTEPLVLWLSPRPDSALLDVHARLHALIGKLRSDPHYRPGAWQPHCTIAAAVSPERTLAAKTFADKPIESFKMIFDIADALEWPPVSKIGSRKLL